MEGVFSVLLVKEQQLESIREVGPARPGFSQQVYAHACGWYVVQLVISTSLVEPFSADEKEGCSL